MTTYICPDGKEWEIVRVGKPKVGESVITLAGDVTRVLGDLISTYTIVKPVKPKSPLAGHGKTYETKWRVTRTSRLRVAECFDHNTPSLELWLENVGDGTFNVTPILDELIADLQTHKESLE